jgi:urease accessory protein
MFLGKDVFISMEINRFLTYAQLLDSALPVGAFSHSFGLETAVQSGKVATIDDLDQFIRGQIHGSLIRMEGVAIQQMYAALEHEDYGSFCFLDQIVHIQRTPKESRDGLHKMGKRFLRLAKALYPWMEFAKLEQAIAEHNGYGTFSAVHAYVSYQLKIPCDEAVQGYLYTSVQTIVNSALRLMSIGQTEGQQMIQRSIATIGEEWRKHRERPDIGMHSFAVAQDIDAMNHETLYSRLFMS